MKKEKIERLIVELKAEGRDDDEILSILKKIEEVEKEKAQHQLSEYLGVKVSPYLLSLIKSNPSRMTREAILRVYSPKELMEKPKKEKRKNDKR